MQPAISSRSRRIWLALALLAAAGAGVSSVSLYHHYGASQTSYCDFGENFNCDLVNRSTYSRVFGIPVALIGIIGYVGLLVLATRYRNHPSILLIASTGGLGFALYLTYVEAFVLAVWCILCLLSLSLIWLITMLAAFLVVDLRRQR
jgi:uncharacterized membrane protein